MMSFAGQTDSRNEDKIKCSWLLMILWLLSPMVIFIYYATHGGIMLFSLLLTYYSLSINMNVLVDIGIKWFIKGFLLVVTDSHYCDNETSQLRSFAELSLGKFN